ncbi:unnamed protein product [Calicophoron daubneyi]|uniref:Muscleblind-like protein n=1 Tax=Calicophoron daubneyi TaxID=300641 RepID=A0AAV2TSR9_CALDB
MASLYLASDTTVKPNISNKIAGNTCTSPANSVKASGGLEKLNPVDECASKPNPELVNSSSVGLLQQNEVTSSVNILEQSGKQLCAPAISRRKRRQDWCRWPVCEQFLTTGDCPSMKTESGDSVCLAAHISASDHIPITPEKEVRVCFDSMGLMELTCRRPDCHFYHPPKIIRDQIVAKRHAQYLREKVFKPSAKSSISTAVTSLQTTPTSRSSVRHSSNAQTLSLSQVAPCLPKFDWRRPDYWQGMLTNLASQQSLDAFTKSLAGLYPVFPSSADSLLWRMNFTADAQQDPLFSIPTLNRTTAGRTTGECMPLVLDPSLVRVQPLSQTPSVSGVDCIPLVPSFRVADTQQTTQQLGLNWLNSLTAPSTSPIQNNLSALTTRLPPGRTDMNSKLSQSHIANFSLHTPDAWNSLGKLLYTPAFWNLPVPGIQPVTSAPNPATSFFGCAPFSTPLISPLLANPYGLFSFVEANACIPPISNPSFTGVTFNGSVNETPNVMNTNNQPFS